MEEKRNVPDRAYGRPLRMARNLPRVVGGSRKFSAYNHRAESDLLPAGPQSPCKKKKFSVSVFPCQHDSSAFLLSLFCVPKHAITVTSYILDRKSD